MYLLPQELWYLHYVTDGVGQQVAEGGYWVKVKDIGGIPVLLSVAADVLQVIRDGQRADHQRQQAAVDRWTL